MMADLRTMLTCRWAARRVQRYLDGDPAAPLGDAEARRLQEHLAKCARCSGRIEEYRALGQALRAWSARNAPEPERLTRLQNHAEDLLLHGPQ